ncbi:hypothetical protein C8Q70DRAFT_478917 [Cubamyces menziesii]|nr:hypothetical protein C8Q70DRAFT_478917 [Cubamyces menziesii]
MPRRDGPQAWLMGVYILVSLLVSTILTTAASDEPTFEPCGSSSWSWMYNSEGLSPCEVWEWVSQLCPSEESMSDCVCNTVTYSLWAACMLCTGESAANFSTYSHNQGCVGKSSSPPSGGADIPEWASLPLKDGKTFNEQAAKHEATGTRCNFPLL